MAKAKQSTDFVPGRGYDAADWEAVSAEPEWTEADFARARSLAEVLPDLAAAADEADGKVVVRIDADLAERLAGAGADREQRINAALRALLDRVE